MSWEKDPLWTKARLFLKYAFEDTERDDPKFGLWCSMGLELLARASLSSISPTLLALPDRNHIYLLHALRKESEVPFPQSIPAAVVFDLCKKIYPGFSEEDHNIAKALLSRRNAELHSGTAAFIEYKSSQWLTGFYHACKSLVTTLEKTLVDLFGEEEARLAEEILSGNREIIKTNVLAGIAAHKKVFESKKRENKEKAKIDSEKLGLELSTQRHHRVTCPACQCVATVQGREFGKEHVVSEAGGNITIKQAVLPTSFSCSACGLNFTTFTELEIAGIGNSYTRRKTCSAAEYYGLIDPENIDEYLASEHGDFLEYDNE
ncbi:MAG: hypothetical protein WC695_02930 [Candidatus Omnitrophota bacterium]